MQVCVLDLTYTRVHITVTVFLSLAVHRRLYNFHVLLNVFLSVLCCVEYQTLCCISLTPPLRLAGTRYGRLVMNKNQKKMRLKKLWIDHKKCDREWGKRKNSRHMNAKKSKKISAW